MRLTAALAALVLVVAVVVFMSASAPNVAGGNDKLPRLGVLVAPGGRVCQAGEDVPKAAAALRIWVQTKGKPGAPVDAVVTDAGSPIASGRAAGGYVDGPIAIPLRPVPKIEHANATVCIRNGGQTQAIYMGDSASGSEAATPPSPQVADTRPDQRLLAVHEQPSKTDPAVPQPNGLVALRLEWRFAGATSRFGMMPALAQRVALNKASFVGSWTFWLLAVAMVLVGAAVIRLVVQEAIA